MKISLVFSVFHISLLSCITCAVSHENINTSSNILLKWSNIAVSNKKRKILTLGSGCIYTGQVLGVIGPSGCGKSTFLSLLSNSGYTSSLKYSHDIELMNHHDDSTVLSDTEVGFVHQHDTFFSMLTVYETIKLATQLRTLSQQNDMKGLDNSDSSDRSMDIKGDIDKTIDNVLYSLSLLHISNSYVGNPEDITFRGISGGERKRLAISCEISSNPHMKLLLADEPTSGLDSFQSHNVVSIFKNLALTKNLSIVLTLHQPRTSIWDLLDNVMILTPTGYCVYHGQRSEVLQYFDDIGYKCPINTNPAEFLIDLVSVNTTNRESIACSYTRIQSLVDRFKEYNTNHTNIVITNGFDSDESVQRDDSSIDSNKVNNNKNYKNIKNLKAKLQKKNKSLHDINAVKKNQISLLKSMKNQYFRLKSSIHRFYLLFQRSFRQVIRNWLSNFVQLSVSIVLAAALATVYGSKNKSYLTEDSVSNRVIILANAVINICLLSMIKTLQLFKNEKNIINRERKHGLYNSFEYLFSKILAETPWEVAVSSVSYQSTL